MSSKAAPTRNHRGTWPRAAPWDGPWRRADVSSRQGRGVRIPRWREAYKAAAMDKAGRDELHRACRHQSRGRCPIEAAETVTTERLGVAAVLGVAVVLAFAAALWAPALVAWRYFPNWTVAGKSPHLDGPPAAAEKDMALPAPRRQRHRDDGLGADGDGAQRVVGSRRRAGGVRGLLREHAGGPAGRSPSASSRRRLSTSLSPLPPPGGQSVSRRVALEPIQGRRRVAADLVQTGRIPVACAQDGGRATAR